MLRSELQLQGSPWIPHQARCALKSLLRDESNLISTTSSCGTILFRSVGAEFRSGVYTDIRMA